jgi:hypothetical protein
VSSPLWRRKGSANNLNRRSPSNGPMCAGSRTPGTIAAKSSPPSIARCEHDHAQDAGVFPPHARARDLPRAPNDSLTDLSLARLKMTGANMLFCRDVIFVACEIFSLMCARAQSDREQAPDHLMRWFIHSPPPENERPQHGARQWRTLSGPFFICRQQQATLCWQSMEALCIGPGGGSTGPG